MWTQGSASKATKLPEADQQKIKNILSELIAFTTNIDGTSIQINNHKILDFPSA